MSELPKSWVVTTLDSVADWGSGGTPSRKNPEFFNGAIPWIKTGELGDKYVRTAEEFLSEEAIKKSSAKVFPKGSVGIAMYGATIGKASIWGIDASTNQACAVAQCNSELIDAEFLYYFLLSEKRGFINAGKGGAQPNISQGILKDWPIALPPSNEQKRIIAKIEELFSELDSGIESLKTARAQLKVYRQAVLKHAFEGKLTAAWRKNNKDKLESAAQLLAHIKCERDAEGKRIGKKNLKEPRPLSAEDFSWLFPVPEGWCWERLGWMTCGIEYGTGAKSSETGEVPVLRMGNIQNMKFDWDDLVYTSDAQEISDYLLHEGDVLFNRTNSPELVGKTAIYKGERPAIFAGYLMRINQISSIVDPRFLNFYLNCHTAKQYGNQVKTDGVNQSNINGEKLAHYPFPYCSLEEQRIIVELLEEQMSSIDRTEADIDYQLQKSEALRQSILKKAFSGQLVAQDANDKPASALLERIRAEKTTATKKPKAKRRAA